MAEAEEVTEGDFEAQTEVEAEAEAKTVPSAPAAAVPQSGVVAGVGDNPNNFYNTS